MSYKYYLPNEQNQATEYTTESNSLIVIGANGSGKSKLGAWMEQKDLQNTHRIGAQRSLTFGPYIQQKSYEQASNMLIYGNEVRTNNHDRRWNYDGEKYNYTSSLLQDYEYVLSALVAKKTKQEGDYIDACRTKERANLPHDPVPEMVIDVLKRIWKSVFPQREIKLNDGKVTAVLVKGNSSLEYNGRDMSDGERVALYLIAQALCVPDDKTIIIDEPELHLHRSIMNRLWTAIENERQDCLFMYITHDTQFAANHRQAKKIWTKSFDGEHWDWKEVTANVLPEQLLLNIMGNRRQVLFVEGEADSYDTKLYSEIYKEYYIVPCGGCGKVIERTKSMKASPQLHDLKCYGIIDSDYRSEHEIEKLRDSDVYTISVAEVENLFIVEELLIIVNTMQGYKDVTNVEAAKDYIINDRYAREINRQICAAVVAELKYQLSTVDIPIKDDAEAKQALQELYAAILYDDIKAPIDNKFNEALTIRDYKKILALFNRKSLKDSVGHFFGLNNNDYCDFIIRHLNGEKYEEIKKAIEPYLPEGIPLEIER